MSSDVWHLHYSFRRETCESVGPPHLHAQRPLLLRVGRDALALVLLDLGLGVGDHQLQLFEHAQSDTQHNGAMRLRAVTIGRRQNHLSMDRHSAQKRGEGADGRAYLFDLVVELVDVVEEGEVLVLRLEELGH